jgi:hypothetical protein
MTPNATDAQIAAPEIEIFRILLAAAGVEGTHRGGEVGGEKEEEQEEGQVRTRRRRGTEGAERATYA